MAQTTSRALDNQSNWLQLPKNAFKTIRDMPSEILTQIIENVLQCLLDQYSDNLEDDHEYDEYERKAKSLLKNLSLVSKAFAKVAQKKLFQHVKFLLCSLKGRIGVYSRHFNNRMSAMARSDMLDHVQSASLLFAPELDLESMKISYGINSYISNEWDCIEDMTLAKTILKFPNLRWATLSAFTPEDWPFTYQSLATRIVHYKGRSVYRGEFDTGLSLEWLRKAKSMKSFVSIDCYIPLSIPSLQLANLSLIHMFQTELTYSSLLSLLRSTNSSLQELSLCEMPAWLSEDRNEEIKLDFRLNSLDSLRLRDCDLSQQRLAGLLCMSGCSLEYLSLEDVHFQDESYQMWPVVSECTVRMPKLRELSLVKRYRRWGVPVNFAKDVLQRFSSLEHCDLDTCVMGDLSFLSGPPNSEEESHPLLYANFQLEENAITHLLGNKTYFQNLLVRKAPYKNLKSVQLQVPDQDLAQEDLESVLTGRRNDRHQALRITLELARMALLQADRAITMEDLLHIEFNTDGDWGDGEYLDADL